MKPCPQCIELGKLLVDAADLISSVPNPTAEWLAKKHEITNHVMNLLRKMLNEEGGK